jgi:aminopeptidase N
LRNGYVKALREAMGEAKFDAFLKTYFRQNRYEIATPARLLEAAESAADRATVRSIYARWIETAATP